MDVGYAYEPDPDDLVGNNLIRMSDWLSSRSDEDLIGVIRGTDGTVNIDDLRKADGWSADSMAWNILCERWGEDEVLERLQPSARYLNHEAQIVASGKRLDRFCVTGAVLVGKGIDPAEHPIVRSCWSKRSHDGLSMQLQAHYHDGLKCVHLTLCQSGNDIAARVDWVSRTSPDRGIGYDFDSADSWSHDDHKIAIATDANAEGFSVTRLRFCELPLLAFANIPFVVYKCGTSCLWCPSGWMGNTTALAIDAKTPDGLKVCYTAGDNWAGVMWQDPEGDWGERPGGANLSIANTLFVRARGEKGGERVSFGIGGLMEKMVSDTCGRAIDVVLTADWKIYRIDLRDLDLSRIKTGFRFWFTGQGRPVVFYLSHVFYDHVHDSSLSGGSRNTVASLWERAEIGDAVAMYELGVRAENGRDGYKPDGAAAKRWYLRATRAGEPRAYEALKRLMR